MEGYIKMRREKLIATGKDPDALLAHVSETPEGALVLPRFQDLINGARL